MHSSCYPLYVWGKGNTKRKKELKGSLALAVAVTLTEGFKAERK